MDPSSNNSFGSFSSGGISGGNDFVGGEQPVDNGLNVATNSAVTDNGGAATNNFGAQVPGASDAGAGVFGATGIAPGVAVNASVGVGAASAPAPQAQPQMTQTQFSTQPQFPMRPQVVASGTGDVVLGGVEPKKSKRGLIAGIIVVFFVFILAGFAVYYHVDNNVATVQTNAKSYREAFNEYANYILYGKESVNDIVEPVGNTTYYAVWSAADEKNVDFFNEAEDLLEIFKNWQERPHDELLESLIDRYSDVFDFYYLYSVEPVVSSDRIMELYIDSGKDVATEYIKRNYKAFEESSKLAQTYAFDQEKIDLSILEQIDVAYANGCIENNVFNQECLNVLNMDFSEQRRAAIEDVQNIVYSAGHDIVFDCFTFADEIYNSKEEQNDTGQ